MKTQKITKQVVTMITEVNKSFKYNHTKNTNDPLFQHMSWLLLKANCYHGFNYFTEDGKLSGGENEKFDHLEFYIN